MEHQRASNVLSAALFTLVPAAYLSMGFWQSASAYTKSGPVGVSPFCAVLMTAVLLVCLLSWYKHRVVAVFGLIACFLWLVVLLLPVL